MRGDVASSTHIGAKNNPTSIRFLLLFVSYYAYCYVHCNLKRNQALDTAVPINDVFLGSAVLRRLKASS
jgi:hypothetical protein